MTNLGFMDLQIEIFIGAVVFGVFGYFIWHLQGFVKREELNSRLDNLGTQIKDVKDILSKITVIKVKDD
jgi:hypothetical protein